MRSELYRNKSSCEGAVASTKTRPLLQKEARATRKALAVMAMGVASLLLPAGLSQAAELPDGYFALDSIESTGTQYIDTEYTHKAEDRVDCVFEVTKDLPTSNYPAVFGSKAGDGNSGNLVFISRQAHNAYGNYMRARMVYGTNGKMPLNDKVTFWCQGATATWTTAGGLADTIVNDAGRTDGVYPMYVFCSNNAGRGMEFWSAMKLYSFKITSGNKVVRDFVPWKKSNGEVGLMDMVEKVFYPNAGTENFGCGAHLNYTIDYGLVGPIALVSSGVLLADDVTFMQKFGVSAIEKIGCGVLKASSMTSYPGALSLSDGKFSLVDGQAQQVTVDGKLALTGGVKLCLDSVSGACDSFAATTLDLSGASEANPVIIDLTVSGEIPTEGQTVIASGLDSQDAAKFKVVCGKALGYTRVVNGALKVFLKPGYASILCIESTGTQYINTEYTHKAEDRIDCVFEVTANLPNSTYPMVFGSKAGGTDARNFAFISQQNNQPQGNYQRPGNALGTNGKLPLNDKVALCCQGATATWTTANGLADTINITGGVRADAGLPMYVFCANNGGSPNYYSAMRLYSFKITSNGTVVRDFHPFRRWDGVQGLLDTVSDVFYPGVGTFLEGAAYTLDGEAMLVESGTFARGDVAPYGDVRKVTAGTLLAGAETDYTGDLSVEEGGFSLADGVARPATVGGKLTVRGGSTLAFDILSDGSCDSISASSVDFADASKSNPIVIDINRVGGFMPEGGRYVLVSGGLQASDEAKFRVSTRVPGFRLSVHNGNLEFATCAFMMILR